ncbi:hypothetical protein [Halomonas sp. YLGW01]|uniref:hypothetical protein n=1 Tax=Halomonas sp. YLGW01 TaxID=2773308 RepID=UPI001783F2E6|nr:hypothetical protein [Halomonas sp. YLGW01]
MRNLLLMRRPLPRGLLVSLHLLSQLGVLATGGLWTREALAPLATTPLGDQWPMLALGSGATLAACLLVRMLFELLMTPHHVQAMLQRRELPFTRSTRRRPAVHDEADSWVGEARRVTPVTDTAYTPDEPAAAPVVPATEAPAPAAQAPWPRPREPQLDLAATAWPGEYAPQSEPRL